MSDVVKTAATVNTAQSVGTAIAIVPLVKALEEKGLLSRAEYLGQLKTLHWENNCADAFKVERELSDVALEVIERLLAT